MKRYTYAILSVSTFLLLYHLMQEQQGVQQDSEAMDRPLASVSGIASTPLNIERSDAPQWELPVGATPLEIAKDFLKKNGSRLQLQEHHELRPTIMTAPLRTTIKYAIYENGFPVLGMEVAIQTDRHLNLLKVWGNYRPLPRSDFSKINKIRPETTAKLVPVRYKVNQTTLKTTTPVLFATANTPQAELSFILDVTDRAPFGRSQHGPKQIVVRADDGQVLRSAFPRREF